MRYRKVCWFKSGLGHQSTIAFSNSVAVRVPKSQKGFGHGMVWTEIFKRGHPERASGTEYDDEEPVLALPLSSAFRVALDCGRRRRQESIKAFPDDRVALARCLFEAGAIENLHIPPTICD